MVFLNFYLKVMDYKITQDAKDHFEKIDFCPYSPKYGHFEEMKWEHFENISRDVSTFWGKQLLVLDHWKK